MRVRLSWAVVAACWFGMMGGLTAQEAGSKVGDAKPAVDKPLNEKPVDGVKAKKVERAPIYDEAADAKSEIAKRLARAKKENKRVLIQWGANWCGWCHLLHDKMKNDGEIQHLIRYEYEVVLVDVGHMDKNQDLVAQYETPLEKQGLPFLTVLDGEGKIVCQQETSSLESKEEGKKEHDQKAVLEFLQQHQASPIDANEHFKALQAEAKAKKKLVFLHFGAPWCGWCFHMENWMAEPDVAAILDKVFVDAKVDTDRMTAGNEIYDRYCEVKSGIPWFGFVDPQDASMLIHSDGKNGNIGFPSTDEEIAHFIKMLESIERFSAADLKTLQDSLVQNRIRREGK